MRPGSVDRVVRYAAMGCWLQVTKRSSGHCYLFGSAWRSSRAALLSETFRFEPGPLVLIHTTSATYDRWRRMSSPEVIAILQELSGKLTPDNASVTLSAILKVFCRHRFQPPDPEYISEKACYDLLELHPGLYSLLEKSVAEEDDSTLWACGMWRALRNALAHIYTPQIFSHSEASTYAPADLS